MMFARGRFLLGFPGNSYEMGYNKESGGKFGPR